MKVLVYNIYIYLFKKHTLGPNNSLYGHSGPFYVTVLWYGSDGWPIDYLQNKT